MRSFLVVLLAFALCLSQVAADTCLAYPASLPQGAACGGAVDCANSLYCDRSSVCVPRLSAGATCNIRGGGECVSTARCKGPDGTLQCVANANPGEPCSTQFDDTIPACGSGLNCDLTSKKCTGGKFGDACFNTVDCLTNLTCTDGTCKAVAAGAFCTSTTQCGPGYICLDAVCTAKVTTGGSCLKSIDLCTLPDFCVYNPIANTTTCLAYDSVEADGYCGSYGFLCKGSSRCFGGVCSPARLDTPCTGGGQCSYDQNCNCGGFYLYDGYGSCTPNNCWNAQKEFALCSSTKCTNTASSLFGQTDYSKACLVTNCNETLNKYYACSSASALSLSFALVALVSFLVSYVSF